MELIKEAGCVMKDADLLNLLRGIYKAGYHKALKHDDLVEEENSPRLPYI